MPSSCGWGAAQRTGDMAKDDSVHAVGHLLVEEVRVGLHVVGEQRGRSPHQQHVRDGLRTQRARCERCDLTVDAQKLEGHALGLRRGLLVVRSVQEDLARAGGRRQRRMLAIVWESGATVSIVALRDAKPLFQAAQAARGGQKRPATAGGRPGASGARPPPTSPGIGAHGTLGSRGAAGSGA